MERDPLFTDKILPWAKTYAFKLESAELSPEHILLAALKISDTRKLLTGLLKCEALSIPQDIEQLLKQAEQPVPTQDEMPLSPPLKLAIGKVYKSNEGIIKATDLLKELLSSPEGKWKELCEFNNVNLRKSGSGDAISILIKTIDRIEDLRWYLKDRIIGQDQAIEQVCDAFFTAEACMSNTNMSPRAVLTFIGPTGVGKTYMAEEVAEWLSSGQEKKLLRLDMNNYIDFDSYRNLVGFEKIYRNATPGILTSYVKDNPESVILVDKIENAHPVIQNIFTQILDTGRIEDKNLQTIIDFSRVILIFSTNIGQSLYDSPNRSGFLSRTKVNRTMIMDSLTTEVQGMKYPGLLLELIPRLGKGYPAVFHRFDAYSLERLASQALEVTSKRLYDKLGLEIKIDDSRIPTLLVLKYGSEPNAYQLKAFVESTLLDNIQDLIADNRELLLGKDGILKQTHTLRLILSKEAGNTVDDIDPEPIKCLIVDDDPGTLTHCKTIISDMVFSSVNSREGALEHLRTKPVDAVLLDLNIGEDADSDRLDSGLEILDGIRSLFPNIPVYLFSEFPERRKLANEVLERIARAGGGRDFIRKDFTSEHAISGNESHFVAELKQVLTGLRSERTLRKFLRSSKTIDFDVLLKFASPKDGLDLQIDNLKVCSALSAAGRSSSLGYVEIPKERFKDVVGMNEAKLRLQEVVGWLRNPMALKGMGVELPRGLLLTGPPGTGKTMLARAVAGEANLPFFAISATDFFSKWAGESEERVRMLFNQAKRYAPSVIFIDEIDALGGERGRGGSSSDWKEGMLNQLLVCMDGFSRSDEGPVFLMAATNRADMLDSALTRPGRFDFVVYIEKPDKEARRKLLELRCREMPLGEDINLDNIATRAAGLSGASIVQIVKEAAILAIRDKSPVVHMRHFEEAVNNVKHGLAKGDRFMSPDERWSTAVHEAGHAVANIILRPEVPLIQVTILPRGDALGFVESARIEGDYTWTRKEIQLKLQTCLGGRAAEELILGIDQITNGCVSDIEFATWLVTQAITRWGMDEKAGILSINNPPSPTSERTNAWVREAYESSKKLLENNKDKVTALAKLLMEKETMDGEEVKALCL